MNVLELLTMYEQNDSNKEKASRIRGHYRNYSEFMPENIEDISAELLRDLCINKIGCTKLRPIMNNVGSYKHFLNWCLYNGYVKKNVVENSSIFFKNNIVDYILEYGDVKYYKRSDIYDLVKKEYNKEYYLMILLSVYDGISDMKELVKLKYTDIDFENKWNKKFNIKINDDLLGFYEFVHNQKLFEISDRTYEFDNNEYVFRKVKRTTNLDSGQTNIFDKFSYFNLSKINIYDSGMMTRFIEKVGLEKAITYFNVNFYDRKDILADFKNSIQSIGYTGTHNSFLYNYCVYIEGFKRGIFTID